MRKPENSDLWSAIRGCGMTQKSKAEVEALLAQHEPKSAEFFASAVIAEAARQVLAGRLYRKDAGFRE